MSTQTIGRIVGALVLLAYVAYLTGGQLVESGAGTPATLEQAGRNPTVIAAGAVLMLANSAIVVGIGALMLPVLRQRHPITAAVYLAARISEAVLMAVGVLLLLLLIPLADAYSPGTGGEAAASLAAALQQGNQYALNIAMIGLGLGSVLFCHALLRSGLVPRYLAVLGLIGYPILAAGEALSLLGYDVGMVHFAPGGLFEVALGVLLLIRGFPAGRRSPRVAGAVREVPVVH